MPAGYLTPSTTAPCRLRGKAAGLSGEYAWASAWAWRTGLVCRVSTLGEYAWAHGHGVLAWPLSGRMGQCGTAALKGMAGGEGPVAPAQLGAAERQLCSRVTRCYSTPPVSLHAGTK